MMTHSDFPKERKFGKRTPENKPDQLRASFFPHTIHTLTGMRTHTFTRIHTQLTYRTIYDTILNQGFPISLAPG